MYRQLMMHASIFRIPPCVQVIIQKSVMLHISADVLTDFHNVVEEEHLSSPLENKRIDIAG